MPDNVTVGAEVANDSIAGLIQVNDSNLADWEHCEVVKLTPFFSVLPWFPASNGTQHKFLVETAAATAAFRAIGVGVTNAAGKSKQVTIDLKYLDGSFDRDVALARGKKDGEEAFMEKESAKSLSASLVVADKELIQGIDNDAEGYAGLAQLAGLYDGMAMDLQGAGGTRVYMMIMGEDEVCGIAGNDGRFDSKPPVTIQKDDGTGKKHAALFVDMGGYMCLQVGGKSSIAVAFNIDGTDGKIVDDDLLADLYSLFPAEVAPRINCILMSRVGAKQLRKSRTATNPTGAPAPFATSWNGAGTNIPIVIDDALDDDAAQVQVSITGDTTDTSAVIGDISDTSDLRVGMAITGAGIPADSTILSIDSETQITISADATATGGDVALKCNLLS